MMNRRLRVTCLELFGAEPRVRASETFPQNRLRNGWWVPLDPMREDVEVRTCLVQAIANAHLRGMHSVEGRGRVEESARPLRADSEIKMVVLGTASGDLWL